MINLKSMKKFFSAIFSAVVLFAACQKNEIAEPSRDGQVLYATIEDWSSTRTVMDEDNNIRWSEGDQIVGFVNSTLGLKYQVTASSVGQTSASFDEVGGGGLNAGTELDHIIAYYPYSSAVKVAKSGTHYALEVVLPSDQTYAHESFGNGSFPMVAVSQTNNITFRNVFGGMKLQLKGTARIASIKVEGKNNEKLSGKASVTAYTDGSKPSIAMADDASASAVLNCGTGVQLDESTATEFIISLPPTVFTKGFTITVTDINGATQVIETSKSNTVFRSSLLVMPVVTVEIATTPQEGDYVDEYGINHGPGVEIDGVVWAPVNCGYHATDFKYGKLYQWGRKFGQGYDGEFYINEVKKGGYSDAVVPEYKEVFDYYDTPYWTYYAIPYWLPLSDWQSHVYENTVFMMGDVLDNPEYYYPDLWNLGDEYLPIKTEYDPCPDGWRVPTHTELDGLRQHHSQWMLDEDQSGLWISDSPESGPTVPCLFLPASGTNDYRGSSRGLYGIYWSSSICPSRYGISYHLSISERSAGVGFGYSNEVGCSIRCVKSEKDPVPVDNLILNKASMALVVHDSEALSAAIVPSNATHNKVYWWSDNVNVATVDENGNVEAVSLGTANITAMSGMKRASCLVTVVMSLPSGPSPIEGDYVDEYGINHGQGIEIDGVVWAPVNCGYHATDFKYGKLYQWGRKYGQGYNGSIYDPQSGDYGTYSDDGMPKEIIIEQGVVSVIEGNSLVNETRLYKGTRENDWNWCSITDDRLWNLGTDVSPQKTEYDPCPKGWRVPTGIELISLVKHCSLPSQIELGYYGQQGSWFSGIEPYDSDAVQVFLPYSGFIQCRDEVCANRNFDASYWSSSVDEYEGEDFPKGVGFGVLSNTSVSVCLRSNAYSVRCVRDCEEFIEVESIALNETSMQLSEGASKFLTSTIIPSNANHAVPLWYSSDSNVATVDQNGKVAAVARGTTTIIAVAGMQTAECVVTVGTEAFVDLSLFGTANSYIVSQKGSYKFKAVKGNISEAVGAVASAEVLWESFGTDVTPNVGDLVKNVKYADGAVRFETADTFKEGNAVIAAKDALGNILWSWHIWLTDEPEGQVYYNGAGTMMDRNLGATSATPGDVGALGLLYQWGRKDPFLGSSSISESVEAKSTITWPSAIQSDSSRGTIAYAIANPLTFITHNINNLDWCFTGSFSTDNTRWASSSDAKSIYDPCPVGWRIPANDGYGVWATSTGSYNTFHGYPYDNYNFGINFSGKYGSASTIWYPSAGYRNLGSGSISNVGIDADVWLVYPLTNEMGAMSFDCNGNVAPLSSSYRANGLSVRCIQE